MKDVLYGRRIPAGTLMLWIKSGVNQERLQSSLDQLRNTLRDNKAKEQNISNKQNILELLLNLVLLGCFPKGLDDDGLP